MTLSLPQSIEPHPLLTECIEQISCHYLLLNMHHNFHYVARTYFPCVFNALLLLKLCLHPI